MRIFARDWVKNVLEKLGMSEGQQIESRMVSRGIENAQKKVEARNFEIRKNLTFEVGASTLDYQVLDEAADKEDETTVLVVAVANLLLDKHLRILQKAGIKPSIVDVLPLAISNVFWRENIEKEYGTAFAMVHLSPTVCTVVFDGSDTKFYTRSIYFSAEEVFGESKEGMAEAERERRLKAFGDEIKRSLSFYEKTYRLPKFSSCYLMGEYVGSEKLTNFLKDEVDLETKFSEFAHAYNENIGAPKGKYDIAVSLGMRTE